MMHAYDLRKNKDSDKKLVLTKAIIHMTEQLAFSRRELATILGSSEPTLSRLFNKKGYIEPSSKEGEIAILILRFYRSLDTLFGGNAVQCRLWLRSENKHLKGAPINLITSIEGLILVIQYLDAMRGRN